MKIGIELPPEALQQISAAPPYPDLYSMYTAILSLRREKPLARETLLFWTGKIAELENALTYIVDKVVPFAYAELEEKIASGDLYNMEKVLAALQVLYHYSFVNFDIVKMLRALLNIYAAYVRKTRDDTVFLYVVRADIYRNFARLRLMHRLRYEVLLQLDVPVTETDVAQLGVDEIVRRIPEVSERFRVASLRKSQDLVLACILPKLVDIRDMMSSLEYILDVKHAEIAQRVELFLNGRVKYCIIP